MPFALAALKLLPLLISAGQDLAEFAGWAIPIAEKKKPSDEDWAELHRREKVLRDQIKANRPGM